MHVHRLRFTALYAALALVVAASAFGALRGVQSGSAAPRSASATASCKAPNVGSDPVLTALSFIRGAVERTDPGAGFALATPDLRGRTTCADWQHGKLPVEA